MRSLRLLKCCAALFLAGAFRLFASDDAYLPTNSFGGTYFAPKALTSGL